MIDIEEILSLAVLQRLRDVLPATGDKPMEPANINLEIDEMLPAISADRTISVIPGGVEAGQYATGGLSDLMPRVKVLCVWRSRKIPRDRRREVYTQNVSGLGQMVQDVYNAIHGVNIRSLIDSIAVSRDSTVRGCKLVDDLKFMNLESQFKIIYPADYGSNENQPAGLGRIITFGRARYLG